MKAANPMRRSWLNDDSSEGGWIAHRRILLVSPSWRRRPVPVAKILDRLEIEHLDHGGKKNGSLVVTYDQIVEFGVSRRSIKPAIAAAVKLGLLVVIQSDEWAGNIKQPNGYRLTYVPETARRAPTDEWLSITDEQAQTIFAEFQEAVKRSDKTAESRFPFAQPPSSHLRKKNVPASSHLRKSLVPKWELLSISAPSLPNSSEEQAAQRAIKGRCSKPPAQTPTPSIRTLAAQPRVTDEPSRRQVANSATRSLGPENSETTGAVSVGSISDRLIAGMNRGRQ
jgi:hypothetical protein